MRYIITQKTIYIIGMLSILQSSITVCSESFDITRAPYIIRKIYDHQDWQGELAQKGVTPRTEPASRASFESRVSVSERQQTYNRKYEEHLSQECITILEATISKAVCLLIMEYAKQKWKLNRKFKIHDGPVLRLIAAGNNLITSAEFNAKKWNLHLRFWDMISGKTRGTSIDHRDYRRTIPSALCNLTIAGITSFLIDFDVQNKHIALVDESQVMVFPRTISYLEAIVTEQFQYYKEHSVTIGDESFEPGIISVKFSLCDHHLLTGSLDGTVSIVDLATGDEAYTLHHDHPVTSLTQSSDGDTLLVGLANGEVHNWGGASISHLKFTQ